MQPLGPSLTEVKLSTDRPNRGNALSCEVSREHQDSLVPERIVHDRVSVRTGRDRRNLIPADDHHHHVGNIPGRP